MRARALDCKVLREVLYKHKSIYQSSQTRFGLHSTAPHVKFYINRTQQRSPVQSWRSYEVTQSSLVSFARPFISFTYWR